MKPLNRTRVAKRVIKTIVMLSSRPYSIRELADTHRVVLKTVRRDLRAIEEMDIPLYRTEAYLDSQLAGMYAVDKHWMSQFV